MRPPGSSRSFPTPGDPAKLVEDARGLLSKAAEEIGEGSLVRSIETLRKARNNLRRYLVDKKRPRSRTGPRGDAPA